jgi:hypothetical protein
MHPRIERLRDGLSDPNYREILESPAGTYHDIAAGLVLAMMHTGYGRVNGSDTPFDAANPNREGVRHARDHLASHLSDLFDDEPLLLRAIKEPLPHVNRMGGRIKTAGIALAYLAANDERYADMRTKWFSDEASPTAKELVAELTPHLLFADLSPGFDGITYKGALLEPKDLRPLTDEEREEERIAHNAQVRAEREFRERSLGFGL